MIVSFFGVIVFSIYLIYDTQLIVGKKAHKYSIDDYVQASFQIY